ncbi:MAG: EamA family transporter [Pseudomonadota bacterium]
MKLEAGVIALVLLAAVLHASWNAVIKTDDHDRLLTLGLMQGTGMAMAMVLIFFVPVPAPASWPFLAASAAIHYAYYFSLLRAYAHGDLSLVYPIARGLGPVLVAVLSGAVVGEHLSGVEAAGVALVSLGIVGLTFGGGRPRGAQWHPTLHALVTGMTIAGYTLADGLGVRAAGQALAYIVWLNLLEGPGLIVYAMWKRRSGLLPFMAAHWWRGVIGGVIASAGYGITIWAMSVSAVAHVAALREISVLFAALIGTVLLGESFGVRRVLAASLVVGGLIAMNLAKGD